MPEQNITLIARDEAARLYPDNEARRADAERVIMANLRSWEAYRRADEQAMHWDFLLAHMARTEAEHHPGSVLFFERRAWEKAVCFRLLDRDRASYVKAETRRIFACTFFALPGFTDGSRQPQLPSGDFFE